MACKTAAVLIEDLCLALRDENPEWSNKDIKNKIFADLDGYYAYNTINTSFPTWVRNPIAVQSAKQREQAKAKLIKNMSILKTASKQLPEPPKPREEPEEGEPSAGFEVDSPQLEKLGGSEKQF